MNEMLDLGAELLYEKIKTINNQTQTLPSIYI